MKIQALLIIFILACLKISAQNITPQEVKFFKDDYYNGKVNISQDPKIKNLVQTYVGLNHKRRGFYGYRVKIFAQNNENAREVANQVRVAFKIDNQKAYVVYVAPNFEVHAGDFTKRFEAVKFMNKIKPQYPEAYIIKSIITFPTD